MLGVVTCHFNPNGYKRNRDNYWRFRDGLKYPLTTVELAFDDDPFMVPDAIQIRGSRDRHTIWQKERLLNIGIQSLPPEVDKVAWIDADLLFLNPNWAMDCEAVLEDYPAAQLFESIIDADAKGNFLRHHYGWARAESLSDDKIHVKRPGGAFAFRRDIIGSGLYDKGILGSGDAIQLHAWTGSWNAAHLRQMGARFRKHWLQWAVPHYEAVMGKIGYVPGTCVHLFHGTRENRQYGQRCHWLVESDFCPVTDIKIDTNGLLTWATDKPLLHERCRNYFESRKEDD